MASNFLGIFNKQQFTHTQQLIELTSKWINFLSHAQKSSYISLDRLFGSGAALTGDVSGVGALRV